MDRNDLVMLKTDDANRFVARLIGADLLSRFWIYRKGKRLMPLPFDRKQQDDAEGFVSHATARGWLTFSKEHGLPDAARSEIKLQLEEWPIRYMDSPGGGWIAIEAIKAKGFSVQVISTAIGWTMELATCLLALKCFPQPTALAPGEKEAILEAALKTETSGF